MLIDTKKVYEQFDKYVSQFDINDEKIKLKIDHIKRVSKLSKDIATDLKLEDKQIQLAEVIGIFHDIGRFKQIEIYKTFNDKKSVNHAEMSIKTLFEDGLIKKFDISPKDYQIIKKAVINHNKNKIEEGLTAEEKLQSKIIRDADKLDIYKTLIDDKLENIFWYQKYDCALINKEIMRQFTNLHSINYADISSNADQIPIFYAYIFDLNFDFSIKYLKSKQYLEKITQRFLKCFSSEKVKQQIKELLRESKDYLEKYEKE